MICTSLRSSESVSIGSFAQYAESSQITLAQRNGTHWNHLILLKVNNSNLDQKNQRLQRNSIKSSDSSMNSKYKSPYGCRTNSHIIILATFNCPVFVTRIWHSGVLNCLNNNNNSNNNNNNNNNNNL